METQIRLIEKQRGSWRLPLIVAFSVSVLALVLNTFGFRDYLDTRWSLPLLFKARALLDKTPAIDERVKIYSFDDTTVGKLRATDLSMEQWADVLTALAARKPAAIYIDKFFVMYNEDEANFAASIAKLQALDVPIVTTAFISPKKFKYRSVLDLQADPTYQILPVDEAEWPPMVRRPELYVYGADSQLSSVFRRPGHILDAGRGWAAALIHVGDRAALPHMSFLGAQSVTVENNRLLVDNEAVPLDRHGNVFVNYLKPMELYQRSRRVSQLVEGSKGPGGVTNVQAGDVVVILPAMFTGHADFTVTPVGNVPGGHVIVSLINSVVQKNWVHPMADGGWISPLLIFATIILMRSGVASIGFGFIVLLWSTTAIALFSYFNILVGLVYPIVSSGIAVIAWLFMDREFTAKMAMIMRVLRTEHEHIKTEMAQAEDIARMFIPGQPPAWTDTEIGIFHRPLTAASGDWYAFETSNSGRYRHIILCDITGHGVQAAIIVAACKSSLGLHRRMFAEDLESNHFVQLYMVELNETLYNNGQGMHVTSMVGITIDTHANKLTYSCAGHPPALLFDRQSGKIKRLHTYLNPLGLEADYKVKSRTVSINPGDTIIAYSDGVAMPRSSQQSIAKIDQYRRHTAHGSASTFVNSLNNAVGDEGKWDDDTSLIWIEYEGRQSEAEHNVPPPPVIPNAS